MADPWLALVDDDPAGAAFAAARALATATAVATSVADGAPAGAFMVWHLARKPHRAAVRVDPAVVVGPAGEGGPPLGAGGELAVSWVYLERHDRPLFDDPAVVEANRTVLRYPHRCEAVSTLVGDSVHFAGAVSVVDAAVARGYRAWWSDDPYAAHHRASHLVVASGVFRPALPPCGPGTQRYSGSPWPAGGFTS